MDYSLKHFENLDSSHNAGYFDVNDSDLEFSGDELSDHVTNKINQSSSSDEEDSKTNAAKDDKKPTIKEMSEQFESDMNEELNGIMNNLGYSEQVIKSLGETNDKHIVSHDHDNKITSHKFYDDIYYDSDDDSNNIDSTDQKKHVHFRENRTKLSDDELLYDPLADERDQQWVDKQRQSNRCIGEKHLTNTKEYNNVEQIVTQIANDSLTNCQLDNLQTKTSNLDSEVTIDKDQMEITSDMLKTADSISDKSDNHLHLSKRLAVIEKISSDAILSCPGCMTTLSIDCQQHESYASQFRAMFVMNCHIVKGQTLKYNNKPKSKRKSKLKQATTKTEPLQAEQIEDASLKSEFDIYYPVKCASCNTEVAVYDKDEIFHFYNVLPSQP